MKRVSNYSLFLYTVIWRARANFWTNQVFYINFLLTIFGRSVVWGDDPLYIQDRDREATAPMNNPRRATTCELRAATREGATSCTCGPALLDVQKLRLVAYGHANVNYGSCNSELQRSTFTIYLQIIKKLKLDFFQKIWYNIIVEKKEMKNFKAKKNWKTRRKLHFIMKEIGGKFMEQLYTGK